MSTPLYCINTREKLNESFPNYRKLSQAVKTLSLTDCLDYFLANGAKNNDDALTRLRTWQKKQEVTGRYFCPRCGADSKKWSGTGGES